MPVEFPRSGAAFDKEYTLPLPIVREEAAKRDAEHAARGTRTRTVVGA
ncbi:hypothetical protein AB0K80_12990 [Streptomyces sp. NPDC052682]